MNYEGLLQEAYEENINVLERVPFNSNSKGLIRDKVIGLNKNLKTSTERACVLAEELGHHYTSSGDILDLSDAGNRKQELIARMWSYNKMIGLTGIIRSYKAHCRNSFEMAEYLGVTVEFLEEAIKAYSLKYGLCTVLDNYIIYFEPLGVMERLVD